MKKILLLFMLLMSVCATCQAVTASEIRTLVVYYTYSGVTETLAQNIANECGGTLLQVVDHGNYPRPESQQTYNYANNERSQIDAGNWPEILTSVENFNNWDAIIFCTPLWNGKMANPMLTFLHNHADKLYRKQVALAVTNMISRNVLARYPNLKVVVPHCGAYLPLAVPRMKSLTPVMQANKMVGDIDWEANLAALYYDLAGAHSPETIRMMLTITTPDHLLYGSDYPYVAPQVLTQGLARMKQYLTDEPDLAPFKEMILWKNAEWLLGLSATMPVADSQDQPMLVRLAEIEVYPEYLTAYFAAASEIQQESLKTEPGVLCLFPTQMKKDSTQIRILEIYASQEAYQHHIQTAHFQKYKQGTLHMVKSLKLQDLSPLSQETMNIIFKRKN